MVGRAVETIVLSRAASSIPRATVANAMVRLGKTYGNLMVDLRATNHKLRQRARRIVSQATGADAATAERAIAAAGGDVKVAIVMLLTGADAGDAAVRLDAHHGMVRGAVEG